MTSVPLCLDLVRHGQAVDKAEGGDGARSLSAAGRATITRLAERFAREGWRPDAVWASPLLRAQETAAILVAGACPGLAIETIDALIPDGQPQGVVAEIEARAARGHLVLVGHQPLMGWLASWLAGDSIGDFPAGALVRLEVEGPPRRHSARIAFALLPDRPGIA